MGEVHFFLDKSLMGDPNLLNPNLLIFFTGRCFFLLTRLLMGDPLCMVSPEFNSFYRTAIT
jgi:hypothetical protein